MRRRHGTRRTRRDPERARRAEAYARHIQTDEAFLVAADAWEEAGDPGRAADMRASQPSVVTGRQLQTCREKVRWVEQAWRSEFPHARFGALAHAARYLEEDPNPLAKEVQEEIFDGIDGECWLYRAREIASSRHRTAEMQLYQLVMAAWAGMSRSAATRLLHGLSTEARQNVLRVMREGLRKVEGLAQ